MRILVLLVLLGACLDVPEVDTGRLYECSGVFVCYGDHFGLTPDTGCAHSLRHAEALYFEKALKATQEAKCGDQWEIVITCCSLGEHCITEE